MFVVQVTFPEKVRWLVLEFDPQCGTAQVEDTLQLYVPARHSHSAPRWSRPKPEDVDLTNWWPVYKKFSGSANWPSLALVLPGLW